MPFYVLNRAASLFIHELTDLVARNGHLKARRFDFLSKRQDQQAFKARTGVIHVPGKRAALSEGVDRTRSWIYGWV